MKQTARIISTYASDASGVCSALFELGGMTVIHDASGCNTTYNTHDEPRWFDSDSLVFISAMTETDAMLGDDEKFIGDITKAALSLHPNFIALAGSPIPMLICTDMDAIAEEVERRTGIPTFSVPSNEMHSYVQGAGRALELIARRMVPEPAGAPDKKSVNILGLTPLDFSVNGSDASIRTFLEQRGFAVLSSWAMGSTLTDLARAGEAGVNLVVSYAGIPAAKVLRERFGTPYVVGVPIGGFAETLAGRLVTAAERGECSVPCIERGRGGETAVLGESVYAGSLAAAMELRDGAPVRVICPLETESDLLGPDDSCAQDEDELIPQLFSLKKLLADPMYRPICPKTCKFVPLPSEGFSGRIYRAEIPNLIEQFP